LEYVLNIPKVDDKKANIIWKIIAKIPGVDIPSPPPWLGGFNKEGVIITL